MHSKGEKMSSKEKALAKLEKKRLKAEVKIAKERAKAEAAKTQPAIQTTSAAPAEPSIEKIIEVRHTGIPERKKVWKDNVWLYIVVAIVLVIIAWAITQMLNNLVAG